MRDFGASAESTCRRRRSGTSNASPAHPGTVLDLFDPVDYEAFHGRPAPDEWREATRADLHAATGNERPHVVVTSPPCKGFSGLISSKKASADKYIALNRLTIRGVMLALDAWADDPPEFWVMENRPQDRNSRPADGWTRSEPSYQRMATALPKRSTTAERSAGSRNGESDSCSWPGTERRSRPSCSSPRSDRSVVSARSSATSRCQTTRPPARCTTCRTSTGKLGCD